jgi:pilus assembly protein CpaB
MKMPRISKKEDIGTSASGGRKKLFNRKAKAILCFIVVLVIAFVAMPMLYKGQAETGTVAVAARPIANGTEIKASDIQMKTIGTFGIPGDVITDKDDIVGKVAKVDIVEDDVILKSKIGKFASDPIIDSFVQEGKELVSITVKSNAAGLASHIEKGDILNVSCVRESVDEFGNSSGVQVVNYPELQNLEVYGVENAKAQSVEDEKTSNEANSDPIISTITFIANDEQANRLIECEYAGNIHVKFVKRGASVE